MNALNYTKVKDDVKFVSQPWCHVNKGQHCSARCLFTFFTSNCSTESKQR